MLFEELEECEWDMAVGAGRDRGGGGGGRVEDGDGEEGEEEEEKAERPYWPECKQRTVDSLAHRSTGSAALAGNHRRSLTAPWPRTGRDETECVQTGYGTVQEDN